MKTVGFRISPPHFDQLCRGADACGLSVHTYARVLVVAALEDTEREQLQEEIGALQEAVSRHRDEFAAAVLALLTAVRAPTAYTEDQARAWVAENLRG